MRKPKIRIFLGALVAMLVLAAFQIKHYNGKSDHPVGFHFFHSIHLDDDAIVQKENTVIQPLMLSKDHDYDFVLKETSAPVKLTIKDDHGKLIATNYNEKTQEYYTSLIFECHISEFYNVEISSQEKETGECVIYSKVHVAK